VSVSSSQASLKAVRLDLDLSAAGGMTERAVRNKVNNRSGNISLASFKGNVLGQQLSLNNDAWGGNESKWRRKRYEASTHTYGLYPASSSTITISGNQYHVKQQGSGSTSDKGCEARCIGLVSESGSYRLTGNWSGEFSAWDATQLHIYLMESQTSWLSGTTNIVYGNEWDRGPTGNQTFSQVVTLSTNKPYVTLILRNIEKAYSDITKHYTHKFWDWKLEKI